MNSEGIRVTGWQTIDGQRYYFMPDGTRYSNGWLSFGSTYYYLNSNGVRVTGWQTIDGEEYYFDKNGVRQEGYLLSLIHIYKGIEKQRGAKSIFFDYKYWTRILNNVILKLMS